MGSLGYGGLLGGRWVMVGYYNGSRHKKVETTVLENIISKINPWKRFEFC